MGECSTCIPLSKHGLGYAYATLLISLIYQATIFTLKSFINRLRSFISAVLPGFNVKKIFDDFPWACRRIDSQRLVGWVRYNRLYEEVLFGWIVQGEHVELLLARRLRSLIVVQKQVYVLVLLVCCIGNTFIATLLLEVEQPLRTKFFLQLLLVLF